jgi:hypothetical protein
VSYRESDLFFVRDPANALVREVFARFGRAFFAANCLEKAIANILLHLEWRARLRPPMTQEQYEESYDEFYSDLQQSTMGKLVRRTGRLPEVPDAIKSALLECLKARNALTHHYFWDRAGEFAIPEGQREMLDETDSLTALFERTEEQIDSFLAPYRLAIGLTDDMLVTVRDRVIDDARTSMGNSKNTEG